MIAPDDILEVQTFDHNGPSYLAVVRVSGLITSDATHTFRHFTGREATKKNPAGWHVNGTVEPFQIDETDHVTGYNGQAVKVGTWN